MRATVELRPSAPIVMRACSSNVVPPDVARMPVTDSFSRRSPVTVAASRNSAPAAIAASARLTCFLKFDVKESSFSGSKVEFQAASFDLEVYSVESLTKRGAESGRGIENIGKLGAE